MSALLTEKNYKDAAQALEVEVAVIKAVAEVESSGSGFLESGKPKILFEGHIFHKETGGVYSEDNPTISYQKWVKDYYLGGEAEYTRFNIAAALDFESALLSTSWGKFQIMGFNYKACGFDTVQNMVNAMHKTEGEHLMAFINLIKDWGLQDALKNYRWSVFARKYNGPGYKANDYHNKLRLAYNKYRWG